jgi:prolipoprotein diacylglyceryltransferase
MLPVIFSIGSFKLYSFGVFLFASLFMGLFWWWKLGRDEHIEEVSLFDSFFLMLGGFFVVGRGVYVALHWEDFGNIYRILGLLSFPGLSFLGGVVGSVLVLIGLAHYYGWGTWKILDNFAASMGVVLVIASFGAILNGSLPGLAVSWGVSYPGVAGLRIPVDYLVFLWAIIYFGVINRVRKNFRFYAWYRNERQVAPDGLTCLLAVFLTAILYLVRGFLEETWRLGFVSYYSILGLIVALVVSGVIYYRSGRSIRSGQ